MMGGGGLKQSYQFSESVAGGGGGRFDNFSSTQ